MQNDFNIFKTSILENNKELFNSVPKGDLHNHALLGSNRYFFSLKFPKFNLEHFTKSNDITSLTEFIKNNIIEISIQEEPPFSIREGDMIKDGFNLKIDNFRQAKNKGASWLLELENK